MKAHGYSADSRGWMNSRRASVLRIFGGTGTGVTPASADQTSIVFVPPPPPRRPALTAVTFRHPSAKCLGWAVRYSNKCPGAQDESPSPGASSGAEHTNPAAGGGPCRALRAASGGSACPPSAPAQSASRKCPFPRSPSAPLGPQRQLRCPGEGEGSSSAVPAARCPRRRRPPCAPDSPC